MSEYEYSYPKDIYIELPKYEYFHSPSSVDKVDPRFRGRNGIEYKLKNILNSTKTKSGAYLVTGYRGVGKTSLVNKVLNNLVYKKSNSKKKKSNSPVVIRINLGHDELKEKDLLKLIAKSLFENYKEWIFSKIWIQFIKFVIYVLISFSILGIFSFSTEKEKILKIFFSSEYELPYILSISPYSFILIAIFILCMGISVLLKRFLLEKLIKFYSNDLSLRKLRNLIERIEAQLTIEKGALIPTALNKKASNLFSFSKRKTYPIAETKDIEADLINILEFIDKNNLKKTRPKFIFIFDELDKIEAHQNYNITEKESSTFSTSGYSSSAELTRRRQQTTSRILANLKHFFTTARAKFIFIAGREMFDAALADTSDRNYFLGSIFNDVIYVNSFLTEDPNPLEHNKNYNTGKSKNNIIPESGHKSYYHTMIEEFLCQFLLPKKFKTIKEGEYKFIEEKGIYKNSSGKEVSVSLKTYNLYLQSLVKEDLTEEERRKVIILLNQFITYLTHRSAGSPKKLTHLLESYICSSPNSIILDKNHKPFTCLAVSETKITESSVEDKFFLKFDLYAQYTFGFIEYLTIPYYHNISRYVRLFNDKLMVSTTYLLDHLYKFHNFGFSWRNLEVTPEIIDVNKAPILRKLIEDIVHFLGYTHLQYVVSGLYDFKFKKKITQEINFLSKISERESAALNFTLDESREVKEYYNRKLIKLKEEYTQEKLDNFIHSKGYLQQSLGDLYFYDQEYDDSSVLYKNALQQIIQYNKNGTPLRIPLRLLVVTCRIMLKLGLTFERKKAYASALMNYEELSNLILKSTEISLEHLKENEDSEEVSSKKKNLHREIYEQSLSADSFHHLRLKSETAESIRLLFQSFIAKIYIKDKEKIGGISSEDIDSILEEINYLISICNFTTKRRIKSEYYNKIGDFLFFRGNKNLSKNQSAEIFYQKSVSVIHAYKFTFTQRGFFKLHEKIETERDNLKFEELKVYGNNLSNLGNAKFSSFVKENNNTIDYEKDVQSIFKLIEEYDKVELNEESFSVGLLGNIFLCYFFSYWLNVINDDHSKAAFQLIKIFHIIEQLRINMENVCDKLLKKVITRIFESIYRSYHSSTRLEIRRMRDIFKEQDDTISENFHYYTNNLPSVGETQEILMLYYSLIFRSKKIKKILKKEYFNDLLRAFNPSKYANVNSMYGRLNFLYLKSRLNFEIFIQEFFEKNLTFNPKPSIIDFRISLTDNLDKELAEYLISDSIYCLTETIRLLKIFGVNYITNHATYGFAFERRAWWCEQFYSYIKEKKNHETLYGKIRKLVGAEAMPNLTPQYNYEKAIAHYIQSIETHTGKYAYKKINESMYYLEDDYNDEQLHFFAALERYKVHNRIPEKIIRIKKELNNSKIYGIDNHLEFDLGKITEEV